MANYRILSVDPSAPCVQRMEHVDHANISLGIGHSQEVTGELLHALGLTGDNFVVVTQGLAELDWPSARAVRCGCKGGYVLELGSSFNQLMKQATQTP
jgi:hypothetical protein